MNELARSDGLYQLAKTAEDILAERAIILDVMKKCMKEGVDYGVIPGCKLPSLKKPGAEKILSTFRIAVGKPIVEDLSTADERRYRVTIEAYSSSGIFLGAHIGECSSNEEKYMWKKAVCNEEWDETPENMRREKWKPGYNGGKAYKVKQIRTSIADVSNTVLSMAHKRATVADTRQITAASDLFTQEIEDLEDLINRGGDPDDNQPPAGKPETKTPQPKSAAAPVAPGELRAMKSKFASKCATCDGEIKAGDEILYDSAAKKAHHPACVNASAGDAQE